MKAAGRKAKGSRLERKVASLIRAKGLDSNCKRMPLSGGFSHLPGDIYTNLPYAFECKNTERHRIWEEWAQAQSQASISEKPILVISGNHRPILAVLDISDLLNLLQIEQDILKP